MSAQPLRGRPARIGFATSVASSFAHWGALLWRALLLSDRARAGR